MPLMTEKPRKIIPWALKLSIFVPVIVPKSKSS